MPVIPREQITPELIAALYKKHNLKAAPYNTDPSIDGGCCGMGVLAAEAEAVDETKWAFDTYGDTFVVLFERGFDAGILDRPLEPTRLYREIFVLGYHCGAKMRQGQ